MSFVVVTDTSGNLPSSRVRKAGLHLIPFSYYIDEKEYSCTDTEAFDGDEFYARIKGGLAVTTSQITPQHSADFFEPFLKEGQDVLYVSMSSGISGSCDCARVAAKMLLEEHPDHIVEIVDTKGASLGEGLVALEAARLRDRGLGVTEAAEKLRDYSRRMCNVFTVDDLMHLKRGGRLSAVKALVGSVLNLKPLLKGNEDGKIVSFASVRGRKRAIEALADRFNKFAVNPESQIVGIAQAGCREDAKYLMELLRKEHPPKEILPVEYEPVTGSHVGPGALALFFLSNETVRFEC